MPISPLELLIILFVVLLLFGAKRVPQMGRDLGRGMREFKDGISNPFRGDDERERRTLESAQTPAPPAADSAHNERVAT